MGEWSCRWFNPLIDEADLDTTFLIRDILRRLHLDRLPEQQVVVKIEFTAPIRSSHWLVLRRGESSVCRDPSGFEVDLLVRPDTLTIHRVWMGHQSFADAEATGGIELIGPSGIRKAFPSWLKLSLFAEMRREYPVHSDVTHQNAV